MTGPRITPLEGEWDIGVDCSPTAGLHGSSAPLITRHQAPRCGLWLPESVQVDAVLVDHASGARVPVGRVATLGPSGLQTGHAELPPPEAWGDQVVLATTIEVYGDHTLGLSQSGLTMDWPLPDGRAPLPSTHLTFRWDEQARCLTYD